MKTIIRQMIAVVLGATACLVAVPVVQAATPVFSTNVNSVVFTNVAIDTKVSKVIRIRNTTKFPQIVDSSSTSSEVYMFMDSPPYTDTTCTYAPGGGIQIKAGGWCSATVYFDGRARPPGGRSHAISIFPRDHPELGKSLAVRASVLFPYTVSPTKLDYGNTTVGGPTVTDSVTIKNTSGVRLEVALVLNGTDFSQFSHVDFDGLTCGTLTPTGADLSVTLKANATCKFTMGLASEERGDFNFAFDVKVRNANGATVYSLSSIPVLFSSVAPQYSVYPNPVRFGNVVTGAQSATKTVTLKNLSTVNEYFQVDVGGFQNADVVRGANKCGGPVAPGKTCTIALALIPHLGGPQNGILTFSVLDDAGFYQPGADVEIPATITATAPAYSISPTAVQFGTVTIGNAPSKQIEVTNRSKSDIAVRIDSDRLPAGATLIAGSARCDLPGIPRVLEPGTSCLLYVRFEPTVPGAVSGTALAYLDDAAGIRIPGSLKSISVKGTGK